MSRQIAQGGAAGSKPPRHRVLSRGGIALLVVLLLSSTALLLMLERSGSVELFEVFEGAEEESASQGAGAPPAAIAPVTGAGPAMALTFDTATAGSLPAGFISARTGPGLDGKWVAQPDPTAPTGPNVLAQLSTDSTAARFPMAVATEGKYRDLEVSVKFKAISGRVDQAGGLVFRYQDANNYYLVRANALEHNYRLYRVVQGQRTQFAGSNLKVTAKEWHTLKVVCVGNQIEASFDGQKVISARDYTFQDPGLVGVWTKADSVTYFDDLEVREVR